MRYAAWFLTLTALAQAPPAGVPRGSISGVVVDAVTHVPLEGVTVNAGDANTGTGAQGEFTLQNVEAGRQGLSVHDERRAASAYTYVLVKPGQETSGIKVLLKLGGTISGKVVDEEGHPVAGAAVLLLEKKFEFGETVYSPALVASSDRHGSYKLAPVRADRSYLVLVKKTAKLADDGKEFPADPEKRPRFPAPAYFPNSPDVAGAESVSVSSSEDRCDVDVNMALAPAYCLDGAVEAPESDPVTAVNIVERIPLATGWTLTPVTAPVADGKFHFCGVHPGEYELSAAKRSASAQVLVGSEDLNGIQLRVRPGLSIPVETTWDREGTARILISLAKRHNGSRNADEPQPSSYWFASSFSYGGRVQVPGPSMLGRVPIDDYEMEFRELPPDCYVKEAVWGGTDLLHDPLRLTRSSGDGLLRASLACDAASLNARVTDSDGNPVSGVNLYVMPADVASPARLADLLRQETVEDGWSGTVASLPPGKFLVLATRLEMDGTTEPILRLWHARTKAKEVTLGPRESSQITLEMSELE